MQHDPQGLIDLLGGPDLFCAKLAELFEAESTVEGEGFVLDVSGLIGQYAHGNEPSHHVAYFFALAGQPSKTEELIREICDTQYRNAPDGLCGNDDCGQMSAWYIFAALGFYPFNPCNDGYVLGAPQVAQATIQLQEGKTLVVKAHGLSEVNKYVQQVRLNGMPLSGVKISHEDVTKGGVLEFDMGPEPSGRLATARK